MFKLSGTLKVINATQVISDRFSKREFVVETQDQYPQLILFQATQDKCALLDNFQQNEQVEVSFNLRGREWTSPQGEVKYFNTIEAWRIERVGQTASMPVGGPSAMNLDPIPNATSTHSASVIAANDDSDDLPF
jgi:hypothetical protein